MKRCSVPVSFLCISFLTIFWSLHSPSLSANDCCRSDTDETWVARAEVAGAWGQFIGQDKNYGEVGLFLGPAPQDNWFFFSDLRGYWLQNHRLAANAGLGMRWLDCCSERVWGGNVYYDYFEGRHKGFNRMGVGLESLGTCLDFRINGYLPLNESAHSSKNNLLYPGGYIATFQRREFAYKGVDAEIGGQIWDGCDFDIYAAAGPYYYGGKDVSEVYGGQIRLELRFFEYLTLEGRFSDDNRYHLQGQGKLVLSIPLDSFFCCFDLDPCRELFTRPVRRNGLPFFDKCCNWTKNW